MEQTRTSIFQRPAWVVVFALTAAIAWGWAFPLIKIGFGAFGITADMTGSKMLFAGIRFAAAGLIALSVARGSGRSFKTDIKKDWWFFLAFALTNTTLHYFFFYIGMSHSEGSRAAILNSLSTFLVVLLACACFKSDKLTSRKILGCAVGFSGILALNLGGSRKRTVYLAGRRNDYPQCCLWGMCQPDDSRTEPSGGCIRRNGL